MPLGTKPSSNVVVRSGINPIGYSRSAYGPREWSASTPLILPSPSILFPLIPLGPYGPHGPYETLPLNVPYRWGCTETACGPCGFHADQGILAGNHADRALRSRSPRNWRLRVPPSRGRITCTWPWKAERTLPENWLIGRRSAQLRAPLPSHQRR
jgi:hypothetical protein